VVPRGGDPLVTDLAFPEDTPYAEVTAGTYTLDVNAAGTDQTVPDAALASGGVYSAFAVGTVYADSLDVLLVQDNASTGATASASASANASASAPAESLPHTGGSDWLPLTVAIVSACSGVLALVLVRRITAA
jgi:LPXTG-motif cell wall-anchored protein